VPLVKDKTTSHAQICRYALAMANAHIETLIRVHLYTSLLESGMMLESKKG